MNGKKKNFENIFQNIIKWELKSDYKETIGLFNDKLSVISSLQVIRNLSLKVKQIANKCSEF